MLEDIPLHGDEGPSDYSDVTPLDDLTSETLDLKAELLANYNKARQLFHRVENDKFVPPNQKAQVLNTISGIIRQMVNTQAELHNMQTFKMMEEALISTLREFDMYEKFLERYAERCQSAGN